MVRAGGNPGPGGWAFILRHPASGREMEQSGGLPDTTNNQMELQAVISGLATLKKPSKVEVITDSTYVAKGCLEWMHGWKKRNWQRKERQAAEACQERGLLEGTRRTCAKAHGEVYRREGPQRPRRKRTL